jgi:tetratricopeptide (TPR) repeat protein
MFANRLVCLVITLLLLAVSCSRDPEKVKKAYVDRGNEYFKAGKYKEASIMYRSALKKDLKYGEAYYRLALSEYRLGRFADALRSFQRAMELQPDNLDAATQLADLYLAIYLQDPKHPKQALDELKNIGDKIGAKNPNDFLVLRIKGYVALANKNSAEALAAFEAAQKVRPFAKEIILPLIESLANNNRFEEAEKLAYQTLEKDKTFAAVYDWLYIRYIGQQKNELADKTYISKVANNPKQAFFILQLAGHYFLTNRKPEMEKTLNMLLTNTKDFPMGHAQVGDFYFRTKAVDTAVKHYEEGLRMATDKTTRASYQKRMVDTLVTRGRKQEALDLVSSILKDNPSDTDAIAMRASLWLQDGGKEKVNSAIQELNSVIIRTPENFVLRYNLGRAYVAKGDVEQGRIQFQEAIKYRPDYTPARLALAQLHLAKKEFTKALQSAEDILNYDPNNITARMIRTSCRIGLGDLPTARAELSAVLAANPSFPDALFQMGILNHQEKQFAEAQKNFIRLQEAAPNDPRGLIGRVETMTAEKKYDEAIGLLQTDLKTNPERSFYRLALGNVAVRAAKYDLAIQEYNKLLAASPKNFDVQIRLAETLRLKGDEKAATAAYVKARELNPSDPVAYVRLALMYEGAGKAAEAKPLYEQILRMEPDNPIALNNLAYWLAESGGDLDQALTLAQRAKAKFPNEPNISDTLGWVYTKKNLSDQAVKIFQDLVEKNANNAQFRYHLAVALAQKGDKLAAKRECEKALQSSPTPGDAAKIRELMARI